MVKLKLVKQYLELKKNMLKLKSNVKGKTGKSSKIIIKWQKTAKINQKKATIKAA